MSGNEITTSALAQLSYRSVKLNDMEITWTINNLNSMLEAQKQLNKFLISENFIVSDTFKDALKQLQSDIIEYETSICSVCGDKQSPNSLEYRTNVMNVLWGSSTDTETHTLKLCCGCFDKHIMNGFLGKYVKVTNYI